MKKNFLNDLNCPVPKSQYDQILLAHGSGGKLTRQLINSVIAPILDNPLLQDLGDSAIVNVGKTKLAFSTDGYVVSPLFFPGGCIGDLAVNGTINDLAVSGAAPIALSLAMIIEEGCDLNLVTKVLQGVAEASKKAGVPVATGDTKVVGRGSCDQIYLVTSGIGLIPETVNLGINQIKPGDHIICSGSIGDHGIAIMSAREKLEFSTPPQSDSAALHHMLQPILAQFADAVHFMRDPTRGGVASVLNELADDCGYDMLLEESTLVVHDQVSAACALLGLDPLHIANEGKVLLFVASDQARQVLKLLQDHSYGREAAIIGRVLPTKHHRVSMQTEMGSTRVIHMLPGEQLPRIC